jgi:hypothetical protein
MDQARASRRGGIAAALLLTVLAAACSAGGGSPEPSPEPSPYPSSVPPGEVGPAVWWVDPAELPLDPATTIVPGILVERGCASGRSPEGRVRPPEIEYGDDEIVITFGVLRPEGGQDCQGNPEFPVEIELAEPLGDRTLIDGFDGRDATEPQA